MQVRIRKDIEIEAPVETVWSFIEDPEREMRWRGPIVTELEQIDDGPIDSLSTEIPPEIGPEAEVAWWRDAWKTLEGRHGVTDRAVGLDDRDDVERVLDQDAELPLTRVDVVVRRQDASRTRDRR